MKVRISKTFTRPACLFTETLERGSYAHSLWRRYEERVLVLVCRRSNLHQILTQIDVILEKSHFTEEEEGCQKLPLVDPLIHRGDDSPRFSVYGRTTKREACIHYYSAHSHKTKSGSVIAFPLRALKICSLEFHRAETNYVINSFMEHIVF